MKDRHWLEAVLTDPNVKITSRSMLSLRVHCLDTADAAARSLVLWEQENAKSPGWYPEAFMRASVAFIMSAFAIEAAVNEAASILRISDADFATIEMLHPLQKADELARIFSFDKVKRGDKVCQHAKLLYQIRSGLAHGRAEWSDESKTHAKLSSRIAGLRIPLSPFVTVADKAFPVGCMSGAMAEWAVQTAESYITAFYSAAGIR